MTSEEEAKRIVAERQDLYGDLSPENREKVIKAMAATLAQRLDEVTQPEPAPTDYKAQAKAHKAKLKAQAPAKRMERFQQLHLVEHKTIMPNLAAKSGLFAPVQKGRRKFVRDFEPVSVWGLPGVEVAYQGEQLNQLDLNVYLLLVSFARRRGEDYAAFTKREALKALRMNDSGFSYKVLDSFINRLGATRVQIAVNGLDESGKERRYQRRSALAPSDSQEIHKGLYVVEISKAMEAFFAVDDWTLISLPQRIELGQNQWALAVHAFLVANKPPAWFTWDQIHFLWGQGYESLSMLRRDFRRRVLKPLHDVGFLRKVEEKPGNGKNPSGSIGMWWV